MDSIEVQQMKAQAKEEKARKKVGRRSCLKAKCDHIYLMFFFFCLHKDGAPDSGTGETDERRSRTCKRGDGAKTFSAAG